MMCLVYSTIIYYVSFWFVHDFNNPTEINIVSDHNRNSLPIKSGMSLNYTVLNSTRKVVLIYYSMYALHAYKVSGHVLVDLRIHKRYRGLLSVPL